MRARRWQRLHSHERAILALVAAGLLLLFAVGRLLTPDPRGVGTHEQIGLPPCATNLLFHIPCPFCGMTTAFSLMAHGEWAAAIKTQPAGALLALVAAASFVATAAAAVSGRGLPPELVARVSRWAWKIVIVIVLVAWVYKLAVYHVARP